jgi:hypothetical protein
MTDRRDDTCDECGAPAVRLLDLYEADGTPAGVGDGILVE